MLKYLRNFKYLRTLGIVLGLSMASFLFAFSAKADITHYLAQMEQNGYGGANAVIQTFTMPETNYISGVKVWSTENDIYTITLCSGTGLASGTPSSVLDCSYSNHTLVAETICTVTADVETKCDFATSTAAFWGNTYYFIYKNGGGSNVTTYYYEDNIYDEGELFFYQTGDDKITGFANPSYWAYHPDAKFRIYYDDSIQYDREIELTYANKGVIIYYPVDMGTFANGDLEDWQIRWKIQTEDIGDFNRLYIFYWDDQGTYTQVYDDIATSTITANTWTDQIVNKTTLRQGHYQAFAVITQYYNCGGNIEWCLDTRDVATSDTIDFWIDDEKGYTKDNNPYMTEPGFTPNYTEHCEDIQFEWEVCTEESGYFACGLKQGFDWLIQPTVDSCVAFSEAKDDLLEGFPLNIIKQISLSVQDYHITANDDLAPLHWWNTQTKQYEDTGANLLSSTTLSAALDFGDFDGLNFYEFYYLWTKRFIWLLGFGYILFRLLPSFRGLNIAKKDIKESAYTQTIVDARGTKMRTVYNMKH